MRNLVIVGIAGLLTGCGAGRLANEYPMKTADYDMFTSPAGSRFMAAPSKIPNKFAISLPPGEQYRAGLTFGITLPPIEYFREGAEHYVKRFGENCRITLFEAVISPAHEATYECSAKPPSAPR